MLTRLRKIAWRYWKYTGNILEILQQKFPKSGSLVIKSVLDALPQKSYRVYVTGAPFDKKDVLKQRTVIQCDVVVFFLHAAFSHERMLHLELERAVPSLQCWLFSSWA
jgi:hypothetical protein